MMYRHGLDVFESIAGYRNPKELDRTRDEAELITRENLDLRGFKPHLKTAPTFARIMTEADIQALGRSVSTIEGASDFKVGDFLATGTQGEQYPISAKFMRENKRKIGIRDEDGLAEYVSKAPVLAKQIDHPFAIIRTDGNRHDGKAGDFLLIFPDGLGIVDADIFAQTYSPLESWQKLLNQVRLRKMKRAIKSAV